jgi:hypothetical protein
MALPDGAKWPDFQFPPNYVESQPATESPNVVRTRELKAKLEGR